MQIPTSMWAVVIPSHGNASVLRYTQTPVPRPGPDQVLIRVGAVGLNYLDIFVRQGMPGKHVPLPHISGGDIAGTVAAVGSNARAAAGAPVLEGARVLVDPAVPGGALGEDAPGGMAEFAVVPAANLIPLPDHVSFEEAACLPIAYGTAWRMLVTRAAVRPGETVFVLGASGGVGTAAVQIARIAGARVIAGSGSPEKFERLRALGADEVVDTSDPQFGRQIWQMTWKQGVNVVVNYTGGDTWIPSIRALGRGGRLVTCGATAGYETRLDLRYVWVRELSLLGSDGWSAQELRTLCRVAWEGRIRPIIDRVLPLSEAAAAEHALERREVFGKIILTPSRGLGMAAVQRRAHPEAMMRTANLGDLIQDTVQLRPDQPAILQGDIVITYGDLDRRMNRFANALIALGIRKGDRVAFLFGNTYRFVELFFGAMRAGAVSVPLNIRLTDETLRYILQHAEAKALVVAADFGGRAETLLAAEHGGEHHVEIVVSEGDGPRHRLEAITAQAHDVHPDVPTQPDDLCMQPYTSGSTGRPKGVLLTHGGQLWNADAMRKSLMVDETERALVAVPVYHKNAMAGSIKPFLIGGGSLVILRGFDPQEVIYAIERYRCTYMSGVPAMFKMLVAASGALERYDVSSLRWAVAGSATVPEETMRQFEERFGAPIGEGYGLTEGGPVVLETPRWGIRKYGSTGIPLPGCEIRLADLSEPQRNVSVGAVGELVVRNPGVARGYYKMPDLTRERFTADGWLFTGDLARMDQDGYVRIAGRKDDMINVGGEHVHPKEVEDLLQRHPEVADVAVVPAPHEVKGEAPVAFVVRKLGATVSEADLKEFALRLGPAFAHPRRVYFVERLPLSGTGKIDKTTLRAQVSKIGDRDGR